jgi:transglutaminase-like putative cysteine protease
MALMHKPAGSPPPPVVLQRYFEVALYLLVFTGFATLATTGGLDLPTVLFVSAAFLFRGYLLVQGRALVIPEAWTNFLTLAYVVFYLADYVLISGEFLKATVHLVLFVMVVRLFSLRRDRDSYFLSIIAFLMVLAAAVLTVNSSFLVAFAGFTLMAVATFILMEMKSSFTAATVHSRESGDGSAAQRMAISVAAASPLVVLLILLGAGAIFVVLPRVSAGYLSAYATSNELSTGFSDRVQLGQIGQIQQSSAVVMHIQIDGDKEGLYNLKWRGVTLSRFDGKAWSNLRQQDVLFRPSDGRFALWPEDTSWQTAGWRAAARPIHYRVLMEPVGTNVFFLAPTPHILQGNYHQISTDGGDGVFDLDAEHPISRYEAWSNIARPDASELRAASGTYPKAVMQNYLYVPPLDPRIERLAREVAASAANNYDKATAIESYLLTHFSYTLQLSRTPPRDPLAEFLFVRKQGHCEYFASSMAVMLRYLGIPARVVNGFRGGEFNDVTSEYVLRASDAHSWVEAYFPGQGWVSFDPTPGGAYRTRRGWGRVMLYVDAIQSFWREWVINYDVSHQVVLGQAAIHSSRRWLLRSRKWRRQQYEALLSRFRRLHSAAIDSPWRWSGAAAASVILLLLVGNARRLGAALRRHRLAGHPEKAPQLAAGIWYERMTRRLERNGWRKSPGQTPTEFLAGIDDEKVREWVARFTHSYEWARYGGSTADAQALPGLYQGVVTAARR